MGMATFLIRLSNIVLPRASGTNLGPADASPLTLPKPFAEYALVLN